MPNIACHQAPFASAPLRHLPLVTLYLTERCNSRCVTCDYWRHGSLDARRESVARLLPSLSRLRTRVALISGGEPLLNPEWPEIVQLLRSAGIKTWLLSSGLALAKHATRVSALFDAVTVSLDGTNDRTYAAIRGLDAFDKVCEGIRRAVAAGCRTGIRVTLQRLNFRELPQFVELGHQLGVHSVSFLAADVANPHAFGRAGECSPDIALRESELPEFAQIIEQLAGRSAADFLSGFILESPAKLRRMQQYFAALLGRAPFPPVRCNAPEFSAVVGVRGAVQPCFFIPGPSPATAGEDLEELLNRQAMLELRRSIRAGERAECISCVCSLYREPGRLEEALLP